MEISIMLKGYLDLRKISWSGLVAGACVSGCSILPPSSDEDNLPVPTTITGVQHIGPNFNVSQFYVNGYYGSNVNRRGGGGSMVCCLSIPENWYPGITAEIQWEVLDWSQEVRSEIEAENYSSVKLEGTYSAIVPLEQYEVAGKVFVHFFEGGKVRLISSRYTANSLHHPILRSDITGGGHATTGKKIGKISISKYRK